MMKIRNWMVIVLMVFVCPLAARAKLERTNAAWDTRLPDRGNFAANLWLGYETFDYSAVDVQGELLNSTLYLAYGIFDTWSVSVQTGYSGATLEGPGYKRSQDDATDLKAATTFRVLDETASGIDVAFRGTGTSHGQDSGAGHCRLQPGRPAHR